MTLPAVEDMRGTILYRDKFLESSDALQVYRDEQLLFSSQKASGEEICPIDRLSLDKEPEEFYQLMTEATGQKGEGNG